MLACCTHISRSVRGVRAEIAMCKPGQPLCMLACFLHISSAELADADRGSLCACFHILYATAVLELTCLCPHLCDS